ncbi:MAG: hypothetical protein RIB79_03485 [Allomuricauda sp.]|jgi:hypothetical protein
MRVSSFLLIIFFFVSSKGIAQIRTVKKTKTPLSELKCSQKVIDYSSNFKEFKDDLKYFKWNEFTGDKYQNQLNYGIIDLYVFPDGNFSATIPYTATAYSFGARHNKPYFIIGLVFFNSKGRKITESDANAYIVNCGSGEIKLTGNIDPNFYDLIDDVNLSTKGCFFVCR